MVSHTFCTPNKRLEYLDQLKGFAIGCVIMGHLYLYVWGNADKSWFYQLAGSFEVQIFFLISGYLTSQKNYSYDWSSIRLLLKKKLPLLTAPLLIGPLFCLSRRIRLDEFLFSEMKVGYYFTFILFLMFVLFHCSNALAITLKLRHIYLKISFYCISSCVVFLALLQLPGSIQKLLSLHQLGGNYIFFLLGVFLGYERKMYERLLKSRIFAFLILICFITTTLLQNYFMSFPLVTLQRVSGVWLFIYLFYHFRNIVSQYISVLNHLGRKSFGIYISHFFFLFSINEHVSDWDLSANSPLLFLLSLACTAIIIMLSLITIKLIEMNHILAYFMLGQLKVPINRPQISNV